MSVEVRNGGLSWEARIETDQLEQDATKVANIFSSIGKKQVEEEKKLLSQIAKAHRETYQDGFRALKSLTPEMQKQISILQSFETELLQVGRAQRQLDADFRKGTITQSQYEKASAGLLVRTQELNSNIQKYSNTIRANQAVMNAANGSIDQKKAKLAQLQAQLNSLSEAELKNARIGGQVRAQIVALEKDLGKLDRAYRTTGKGNALLNQVLLATSGLFTITQGSRLIREVIQVRGEIEQLEVAFETMLRSKSAADSLMKDITEVALSTPFKLTEVAAATKQLLAYGFAQDEIKQELLAIGNVASGVGSNFQEVAYAYGTLRSQGRAYMRDIRQFTTRGIPIIEELAKVMGTTTDKVQELVEAGKVGFPEVQRAFQNMTGAGGQFFNLMEKQSQTVTGEVAKLQDKLQLMFNDIGKANDGVIKDSIAGLSFLVEHYKDVIDILGTLIIAYGSYRAAMILTTATQGALGASTLTLTGLTAGLQGALKAMQAAFITSPVGAYTAAITALGLAFYSLYNTINTTQSIHDNFVDSTEAGALAAAKEAEKIKALTDVLASENASRGQKESAIKSLQGLLGKHLETYSDEEIASGKAKQAIDDYTQSIRENASARKAYDQFSALQSQLTDLETQGVNALTRWQRVGEDLRNVFDPRRGKEFSFAEYFQYLVSPDKQDQVILDQVITDVKAQMDALREAFDFNEQTTGINSADNYTQNDAINKLLADVTKYFDTLVGLVGSKADAVKIQEALQEVLDSLAPSDPEIAKVKTQLQKINQVLDTYSLKNENKEQKDLASERKKVLDDLNKLEDRAYKKSFEKREQEKADLKRQLDDLRELAQKAGLGSGVFDRINLLEETSTGDIDYRNETEKLKEEFEKRKKLYQDYDDHVRELGVSSAEKRFGPELQAAKNYLGAIQEEYDKLLTIDPKNRSGVQQERLRQFQEILDAEKREQEAHYFELLKASKTYDQRRKALYEEYERDKVAIAAAGDQEVLAQFEKNFLKKIDALNEEAAKELTGFTEFFENVEFQSRKAAEEGVDILIEAFRKLKGVSREAGGITEQQFQEIEAVLNNIKVNVKTEIPQGLSQMASELGTIAGLVGDANSGFSQMLSTVSGVINGVAKIKSGIADFKAAEASGDRLGQSVAGLGIVGAIAGIFIGIGKIAQSAITKRNQVETENLKFQDRRFIGELAINNLYRERALIAAEVEGSTLKNLYAQQDVLKENLNQIKSDSALINEIFGDSVSENTLAYVNSYQRQTEKQDVFNKVMAELGNNLYDTGETEEQRGGFLGLSKKTVKVFASLAGMSFEEIEQLSMKGQLTEQAEELFQQLVKLKEEGKAVEEQLKAIEETLTDIFTGGLTASGMADGIIAEFQGAGSQIEDILKNAILSGFKYRFLEEPLNEFIDQLSIDAQSGGELTPQEIQNARDRYAALTQAGYDHLEMLEEATGIDLSTPVGATSGQTGIQGGIQRSITEETGAELAGLFRGFYDISKQSRMGIYEHLAVANQQLTFLQQISTNTGDTVTEVRAAVVKLEQIVKNTKPGQGGRDTGWGG